MRQSPSPSRDHLLLSYSTSGGKKNLLWEPLAGRLHFRQPGAWWFVKKGQFRGTKHLAPSIPADAGCWDVGCWLRAALLAYSAPSQSLVGPAEPTLRNIGSREVLQHCTGHRTAFCSILEHFWLFVCLVQSLPGEQSGRVLTPVAPRRLPGFCL